MLIKIKVDKFDIVKDGAKGSNVTDIVDSKGGREALIDILTSLSKDKKLLKDIEDEYTRIVCRLWDLPSDNTYKYIYRYIGKKMTYRIMACRNVVDTDDEKCSKDGKFFDISESELSEILEDNPEWTEAVGTYDLPPISDNKNWVDDLEDFELPKTNCNKPFSHPIHPTRGMGYNNSFSPVPLEQEKGFIGRFIDDYKAKSPIDKVRFQRNVAIVLAIYLLLMIH